MTCAVGKWIKLISDEGNQTLLIWIVAWQGEKREFPWESKGPSRTTRWQSARRMKAVMVHLYQDCKMFNWVDPDVVLFHEGLLQQRFWFIDRDFLLTPTP